MSSFPLVILLLTLLTRWISIIDGKPGCYNLKIFLVYIWAHQISTYILFSHRNAYKIQVHKSSTIENSMDISITYIQKRYFHLFWDRLNTIFAMRLNFLKFFLSRFKNSSVFKSFKGEPFSILLLFSRSIHFPIPLFS